MYYFAAIYTLFTASMAPTTLASLSAEAIKEAVGDGCRNHIDFKGRFRTEAGITCRSCSFCNGSTVNSLFLPQVKDTCIQCTKTEDMCNTFEVITTFENAWAMKYATLTPSALATTLDPKKIIMSGSNDLVIWEDLYSSELIFLDRVQKAEFIIDNEKNYKHYSLQFKRSDDVMQIGKYGLVEAYTKACASELYASITGVSIPVYSLSAPSQLPSFNPSSVPSDMSFNPTNCGSIVSINIYDTTNDSGDFIEDYNSISWEILDENGNVSISKSKISPRGETAEICLSEGKYTFNIYYKNDYADDEYVSDGAYQLIIDGTIIKEGSGDFDYLETTSFTLPLTLR